MKLRITHVAWGFLLLAWGGDLLILLGDGFGVDGTQSFLPIINRIEGHYLAHGQGELLAKCRLIYEKDFVLACLAMLVSLIAWGRLTLADPFPWRDLLNRHGLIWLTVILLSFGGFHLFTVGATDLAHPGRIGTRLWEFSIVFGACYSTLVITAMLSMFNLGLLGLLLGAPGEAESERHLARRFPHFWRKPPGR